jgi:Flp pilus assembly protein TadB
LCCIPIPGVCIYDALGHKSSERQTEIGLALAQAYGFRQNRKRRSEQHMPLIQVVMVLIVVGVLLWLVNRYIPMQGTIKGILNAVVVIATVVWLLQVFGLLHTISRIRVGA